MNYISKAFFNWAEIATIDYTCRICTGHGLSRDSLDLEDHLGGEKRKSGECLC